MAKHQTAINREKIIRELKAEAVADRKNVTFSLPVKLLNQFSDDCEKHKFKMNKVIQKLIEDYLGAK
jgi:hypothetical protein